MTWKPHALACPRCQAEYKNGKPNYFGSDPVCTFANTEGAFNHKNWQCPTALAARDLANTFVGPTSKRGEGCRAHVWGWDESAALLSDGEGGDLALDGAGYAARIMLPIQGPERRPPWLRS